MFYNTYAEWIDEYASNNNFEQFEPLAETEHKLHR